MNTIQPYDGPVVPGLEHFERVVGYYRSERCFKPMLEDIRNVPSLGTLEIRHRRRADPTISGVYAIVNTVTWISYIGSSNNISRRIHEHFSELTSGRHRNQYFLRAWRKYGVAAFELRLLAIATGEARLRSVEQGYLDCVLKVYNISDIAGAMPTSRSPEWRANISRGHQRRKDSMATKTRQPHEYVPRGPLPMDVREKISIALTGKPKTDEHNRKVGIANKGKRLGLKLSPETIAKMVAWRTGRKMSEEAIRKSAEKRRGQRRTEEQKARMSLGHQGYICSEETKKKLSVALKLSWQKRKADRCGR